jgi:hypothetical protein
MTALFLGTLAPVSVVIDGVTYQHTSEVTRDDRGVLWIDGWLPQLTPSNPDAAYVPAPAPRPCHVLHSAFDAIVRTVPHLYHLGPYTHLARNSDEVFRVLCQFCAKLTMPSLIFDHMLLDPEGTHGEYMDVWTYANLHRNKHGLRDAFLAKVNAAYADDPFPVARFDPAHRRPAPRPYVPAYIPEQHQEEGQHEQLGTLHYW